ncbi:MAG: DUF2961 domain-containing protein, partial [Pirellulales bacterium]
MRTIATVTRAAFRSAIAAAVAASCCASAMGQSDDAPARLPSVPGSQLLEALTVASDAESRRVSSANPDLAKNGDAHTVGAGETLVLAELEGPGAITHFWNTVASTDPFSGRSLVLRIYWDGAGKPSVEAPLGDFFGVGHGANASFQSLPVSVSSYGRSRACFWRMPFRKSAKVTLTNEATDHGKATFYYYLDWEKLPELADDVLYFHARYRQAMPAKPGDYTLLETEGAGNYVGTVYSAHQVKTGWFGEGDDRFYIDGEQTPSLRGTGTEDYFNDAWGFRQFATPFYGVSLWEGVFPGDRVTAYRWHLTDPVRFRKSLKVAIEHRGSIFSDAGVQVASFEERPDWLSSVAFWYQTPAVVCEEPLPPANERVAPYRVLAAKDLKMRAKPQLLLNTSDTGVVYAPGKASGELEFDFDVAEKGRYQLSAVVMYSVFGARYQPQLDGQEIGPEIDFCNTGSDWTWISFDLHKLDAGQHTLKFVGRGASPQQRSSTPALRVIGINSIILLRLEDMA